MDNKEEEEEAEELRNKPEIPKENVEVEVEYEPIKSLLPENIPKNFFENLDLGHKEMLAMSNYPQIPPEATMDVLVAFFLLLEEYEEDVRVFILL